MALAKRIGHDSVGSSKKYDAPTRTVQPAGGASRMPWSGMRRRRFVFIVIALVALVLFVQNIPTDVPRVSDRYSPLFGEMAPGHVKAQYGLISSMKNKPDKSTQRLGSGYDGSILFEHLPTSLRPHLTSLNENNVLFALPALTSISNLLPMACEMARNNRTAVHVVLLGRQKVGIKDLIGVNGISSKDCPVIWHDARPDHALESTPSRIERSIRMGLTHCCTALRPQIILVDDDMEHNSVAIKAVTDAAAASWIPLVMLPEGAQQALPWLSLLETASVRKLNEVQIDIVVQAYSESAGSLIRLLRSLQHANYHGLTYPRLTIELPPHTDTFLTDFLADFKWPPHATNAESQLVLRRRIDPKRLSPAEASIRTIESFYPQSTSVSHVLLLSPDIELSPNYLHYLMYTLLEYKYGQRDHGHSELMCGIVLDLPTQNLDDEGKFPDQTAEKPNPFMLSQTPNAKAALIFGDKWAQLHAFLEQRFAHDPLLEKSSEAAKSVSREHPRWLSEILDYMQAEGLYMLYPAFAAADEHKLATLHRELHQTPEEYMADVAAARKTRAADVEQIMQDGILSDGKERETTNDNSIAAGPSLPLEVLLRKDPLLSSFGLPPLNDMPMYTVNGEITDWAESQSAAAKFAEAFSLYQGGCKSLGDRDSTKLGRVEHLFCAAY